MLVIGSLGLIGNICTILKIWSDKKFHTQTFTVIWCLAFADFLSIVEWHFNGFINLARSIIGDHVLVVIVLAIVREVFFFSSLGHMVLLSVVRYLITVHPPQSRSHLTTSVVMLWSVTVWILSLIFLLCELIYPLHYFLFMSQETPFSTQSSLRFSQNTSVNVSRFYKNLVNWQNFSNTIS
jgi:hypothetical protein